MEQTTSDQKPNESIPYVWLLSLCVGLALGAAIGVAIGRIGAGIGIGLGTGVAVGLLLYRQCTSRSSDA